MFLNYPLHKLAKMSYFESVFVSWSNFYSRMAGSGLFLGDHKEIRLVPYG